MTVFNNLFKQQGFSLMLNQFGEDVIYCKYDGSERKVCAVVDRNPVASLEGVEYALTEEVTVTVANCKTNGIAANEIDVGGDFILVGKRTGRKPSRLAVVAVDLDGGGTVTIRLR